MTEKKNPTPQPTPPGVSVHDQSTPEGKAATEGKSKTPKGAAKQGDHPEAAQAARATLKSAGVDDTHADHLEAVAKAVGGRNWAGLFQVIATLIQTLISSGILNSGGGGTVSPNPPANPPSE